MGRAGIPAARACVLAINFNIADEHVTNLMLSFDLVFREYLRSLRAACSTWSIAGR
jgi:hypothetical protein